jgi:hypothetical protein
VILSPGSIIDTSGGGNGLGALGVVIILGTPSIDPAASVTGVLSTFPAGITASDFFAVGGGGAGGGASDGLPIVTPEPGTIALLFCAFLLLAAHRAHRCG